jgi:hypothetical protein
MDQLISAASDVSSVLAMLEGGPANLPSAMRTQTVSQFARKIKVPYYGGYEHFERIARIDENVSAEHVIFRWTMRTEIAELRATT